MADSTLVDLHTRTCDIHAGFVKMVEKADPEFYPVAQRFHDLHHQQMNRLEEMVRLQGDTPQGGSLMSSLQEAVITLRSWFDDIDDDVMDQVRWGEKQVLADFDAAIRDPRNSALQAELGIMKGELTTLLTETSHLD
ncbi:DUF2383 domain-containing protein [Oceaniglobus ichthyenteri]|uniref:DUF2383 domain-containing protein n=1 Tax=Oceaniglobus ichthyenteri TaxID=2136177 RepID=UPI000D383375|nr:DUF2383 domain-containing protein [Oceaniglobus ichthyenteri]